MFRWRRKSKHERAAGGAQSLIEGLEHRMLLSGSGQITLYSDAVYLHAAAAAASNIQGYTPSQIRHAYGFDQAAFNKGAVAADGRGQTIAIVDAYNDPNIVSDLNVFDNQFGVSSPPSLHVTNQSGGATLPSTDAGWSGEIALDVEWVHAIAPDANILLVEANSSTLQDLMAAVNYARHASGVSVVSMSWGGSEFFSWNGSEFTGQTQYDPNFTTPAGHQGVTFIAAAGDSGANSGVQWPASSPNVLSVGGTSLTVQDANGTYYTESSWSGTSGGYSQIEAQPSWQNNVQGSGARSTPDVSYDGDPNTGFAVYDSVPSQGYSGWQEVGGTSAGAPQWAALVAIADQGRVLNGSTTLDGATQTLPELYSLYSAPGTTGYSTYASTFNDVVDSGGGSWHWRWGWGYSGNAATAGYDTATGLGSPVAGPIISALAGTSTSGSSTTGSSNGGSNSSGSNTTTPAQLPASPITGTILTTPPASVLGGQPGFVRIKLSNTAGSRFTGPLSIKLYASTDNSVSSDDTLITTLTLTKVRLRAGGSKTVRVKFDYPTGLNDNQYFVVASIDASGTNTEPAQAATPKTVEIAPETVDLATSFGDLQSVAVVPGKENTVAVTIQNLGNVTASGTIILNLYASASGLLDGSQMLLATVPARKLDLRAGKSMVLHVRFLAPTDASGTYSLIADTIPSTQPPDANSSNDVAVIATA